MSELALPDGWIKTEVSRLGEVVTGKTPKKSESENFDGDVPFVKPSDLNGRIYISNTEDTISEIGLSKVPTLPENTIMVTCIGNLGKVGVTTRECATNQQINSVIPHELISYKYLYYNALLWQQWLEEQSSATTISIVNKSKFSKAPVLLSSSYEQKEIVKLLDNYLTTVSQIQARLDAIPKLIERFRQSVLNDAVSGKLTEEWRNTHSYKVEQDYLDKIEDSRKIFFNKSFDEHLNRTGKKLRPFDFSYFDDSSKADTKDFPSEWQRAALGDIILHLTDYHANGSYKVLKENVELLEQEDYAYMIRATNFEKNNFDDLMLYINKQAYEFLGKSQLFGNEILIGKIGNAGSVYHMLKLNKPASLAMNLFALRFDEELISSRYIYYYLTSSYGEANIQKYVRGVTTKSIDKKSIRSINVNLPPYEEQVEIVKKVAIAFTHADQIEKSVAIAKARVDNLTQSILHQAFTGELTKEWREQNPELISGDNSAEALLAKIEAEKKASGKKGKAKK